MQLAHLARTCTEAFASCTEVQHVFCFGSYAEERSDAYSDLDIQVVTEDYAHSLRHFFLTLQCIDEPLVVFPLTERTGEAAFTVLFWHYSLYHKLDIGLQDRSVQKTFARPRTTYMRDPKDTAPLTQEQAGSTPIEGMPSCSPLARSLYDTCIGATRYVKSRKRQMPLNACRLYQAALKTLLITMYNRAHNYPSAQPLERKDYSKLDTIADPALEQYLYPAHAEQMDQLLVKILISLLHNEWTSLDEDHRKPLRTIVTFVAQELSVPLEA